MNITTLSNDAPVDMDRWNGFKATGNRYEPWFKDRKNGKRIKQEDKWEFPRHRLKVHTTLILYDMNK